MLASKQIALHDVAAVTLGEIVEHTLDSGATFQTRTIRIESNDGDFFNVCLFAEDEVGRSGLEVKL